MYTLDKFPYVNIVPMQSCLCGVFKSQALTGYGEVFTNSGLAISNFPKMFTEWKTETSFIVWYPYCITR